VESLAESEYSLHLLATDPHVRSHHAAIGLLFPAITSYSSESDNVVGQWISTGSAFENNIGHFRAAADGDNVFFSDTTGFDYYTMTISPYPQVKKGHFFQNVKTALQAAVWMTSSECTTFFPTNSI